MARLFSEAYIKELREKRDRGEKLTPLEEANLKFVEERQGERGSDDPGEENMNTGKAANTHDEPEDGKDDQLPDEDEVDDNSNKEDPEQPIEDELNYLLKNRRAEHQYHMDDQETFEEAGFSYEKNNWARSFYTFSGIVIPTFLIAILAVADLIGLIILGFLTGSIGYSLVAVLAIDAIVVVMNIVMPKGRNQTVTEFNGYPFRILKAGKIYLLIPFFETIKDTLPVNSDLTVVLRAEEKDTLVLLRDEVSKKFEIEFSSLVTNILQAIYGATVTPEYKKPFIEKGIRYRWDIMYRAENVGDGVVLAFFKRRSFKIITASKEVSRCVHKIIREQKNSEDETVEQVIEERWLNRKEEDFIEHADSGTRRTIVRVIFNPVEKILEVLLDESLADYGLNVSRVKIKVIDPSDETQNATRELQKLKIEVRQKDEEIKKTAKDIVIADNKGKAERKLGDAFGDRDASRIRKMAEATEDPKVAAEIFKQQVTLEGLKGTKEPVIIIGGGGSSSAEIGATVGATAARVQRRPDQSTDQDQPKDDSKKKNGKGKKKQKRGD